MKKFVTNLKHQVEEHPVETIIIVGMLTISILEVHGRYTGSRAYARAVNYRIANPK
jgi:hypothetical protein